MKVTESKGEVVNLQKRIEVKTTAKHPRGAGKSAFVPAHMIPFLQGKGMIEGSAKK